MVFAEPLAPRSGELRQPLANARAHVELDDVALPIIEADGLDAGKALQRPGEADRGILAAGEQNQRVVEQAHRGPSFSQAPIRSTASCISSREPA